MPGIDARIPLQTRTPQIQSLLDAYSRALQVRGQAQQNKTNGKRNYNETKQEER